VRQISVPTSKRIIARCALIPEVAALSTDAVARLVSISSDVLYRQGFACTAIKRNELFQLVLFYCILSQVCQCPVAQDTCRLSSGYRVDPSSPPGYQQALTGLPSISRVMHKLHSFDLLWTSCATCCLGLKIVVSGNPTDPSFYPPRP